MSKIKQEHQEGADPVLVEKFNQVNKNHLSPDHRFSHVDAQAYLYLRSGDFGDDWRVRLVDTRDGSILMDNLDPLIVDGHTCFLIGLALRDEFQSGIREGIAIAADAAAKKAIKEIYDIAGVSRDPFHRELLSGHMSIRAIVNNYKEKHE